MTNADKLLAAAEELAQSGECDPTQIYSEAQRLEDHMNAFLARVEKQRNLLDLSVTFYTHAKEASDLELYMTFICDLLHARQEGA